MENMDFMRFMAAWALVHESADEGWKAGVARGQDQAAGAIGDGPDAFVDGLAAMISEEKERLKTEIAAGMVEPPGGRTDVSGKLDDLSHEVSELRGRLETMQSSLDAILNKDLEA